MIQKGAEPFFLPGSNKGVLLIHGFTGSPSEMLLLGTHLHKLGYTVLGIRLAGHGTTVEDLARTNRHDWLNSVCDGYQLLRGCCQEIFAIGLSMGGLLTLKLASELPLTKIVIMSTPIFVASSQGMKLLPPLEKCGGRFHRKNRRHLPELAKRYLVSYDKIPLVCVHELNALLEEVKSTIIPRITIPIMIVQSANDHTVDANSAQYIYNHIGSTEKVLYKMSLSGHLVTLDIEHDILFSKIEQFLLQETS